MSYIYIYRNEANTQNVYDQQTYIGYAIKVSILSMVMSFGFGVAGLVISIDANSSSTLSYSLEVLADLSSSALVCWRFWSEASEAVATSRENRGSVGIAFSFLVVAVVSTWVATEDLIMDVEVEDAVNYNYIYIQ